MFESNVAQLVGLLASAFIILGYSSKHDAKLKTIVCIGAALFSAHFFMMGAMTAMIMNAVNFLRIALSIKFHGSKMLFVIFIVIYLSVGAFTYETWIDIFPLISSILGTVSMYFLSGVKLRLIGLLGSSSWLTHNFVVGSMGGIITELFVLTMLLTGIYRLIMDKRRVAHEAYN